MNNTKVISLGGEPVEEKLERELEEPFVVLLLEDGTALNVAQQILEERVNYNVNGLSQSEVQPLEPLLVALVIAVELLEHFAASRILLGRHVVNLFESLLGELLARGVFAEVETDVVHQEGFEFSLQPQDRVLRCDVDVQRAQDLITRHLYVRNEAERFRVDRDTDPLEHIALVFGVILLLLGWHRSRLDILTRLHPGLRSGGRSSQLLDVEVEVRLELLRVECEPVLGGQRE